MKPLHHLNKYLVHYTRLPIWGAASTTLSSIFSIIPDRLIEPNFGDDYAAVNTQKEHRKKISLQKRTALFVPYKGSVTQQPGKNLSISLTFAKVIIA